MLGYLLHCAIPCVFTLNLSIGEGDGTLQACVRRKQKIAKVQLVQKQFAKSSLGLKQCDIMYARTFLNAEKGENRFIDYWILYHLRTVLRVGVVWNLRI